MADLSDLRNRITERAETAIARAAPRLQENLRRTSPVGETQRLKERTTVTARRLVAEVVVGVEYATFVREPTRPHVIVPRNARVLRFQWPAGPQQLADSAGFFHFRRVRHPGTKGNDWYDDAIRDWPSLLERELR